MQNAAALKLFSPVLKNNTSNAKKPACAGFSLFFLDALNLAAGSARFALRR